MIRIFLAVFLIFSFTVGVYAQEDRFAVTPGEKESLLTKTETTLTWFRSMERSARNSTPMAEYRKRISPLELMQAAALLKQVDQEEMSRMVREIFSFLQPTNEECFSIAERLGDELLDALA